MKVKKDILSTQYAQLYVSFTKQEMNQVFSMVGQLGDKQRIDVEVRNNIERQIEDEIFKARLIPIGERNVRYFMEPTKNKPLIVLVQFCTLPYEDFKMVFPKPFKVYQEPIDILSLMQKAIRDLLIATGHYTVEEVTTVTNTSEVVYDIEIMQDQKLIQKIPGQVVSLDVDFEEYGLLFIGKKAKDRVLIDRTHVDTYAVIQEVTDFIEKDITDAIVKSISLFGVKTKEDLFNKIEKLVRFMYGLQEGLHYIIQEVTKILPLEIDDYAAKHYCSLYTAMSIEDAKIEIKEMIAYQYLILYVSSVQEESIPKRIDLIAEMYDYLELIDALDDEEIEYERFMERNMHELRVIEYFINQEIIEDIFR